MTDVRKATTEFLDEHPVTEEDFEELLAVDAAQETWSFEDIPLDSGTFGEVVSQDIVEKHDGEYRLRDRDAVEQALGVAAETQQTIATEADSSSRLPSLSDRFADVQIDRVAVAGLLGALALVVLFRVLTFSSVFRNGDVVLSGNDPYAYRYLVHQLLADGGGVLDVSVLSSLPGGISHGEPLYVATLWWVSSLFGGTGAVDYVLALFPVVSAVVTALLVYALTMRVTGDKRVGIAAVALLAVIPAHAFRTGLGFADHHAFDYPWLALSALAVVSLIDSDPRARRTWGWTLALGVGVGAQTLAWDAGPLLLVPLALYAVAVVPSRLRTAQSPLVAGAPFAGGLGIGAVIALAGHYGFGWHSFEVVLAPALLFVGVVSVLAFEAVARRFDASSRAVLGIEIVGGTVGVLVLRAVFPSLATRLDDGIDFLFTTDGIAETTSLVSGQLGNIVGPIFLFGFALFLALPYLAWASWRCYREHSPTWLAVSCYAWYFLVLSVVQVRFAGQLALFVALFGGLGFVHLAAWVDLTNFPHMFTDTAESPRRTDAGEDDRLEWPERRAAMYTAGLGLGVGSLGSLMTPAKHGQLTVDNSVYEAAKFMREYVDEREWEYPNNYVFSPWSRNRTYNWFVNGESQSYGYAQANYDDFIRSTDGVEWYERLYDRVGFVVTENRSSTVDREILHDHLWSENFGLETDHYQALWDSEDDSRRVYTLVPGARMTGTVDGRGTIRIEGECEINGEPRSVSMDSPLGESGIYDVAVPLPGEYTIGNREVTISEADVRDGVFRSMFDGEGIAHWSFDEDGGNVAYDRVGGRHATITNGEWIDGVEGSAIAFKGDGYGEAHPMDGSTDEFTISAWIKPEMEMSGAIFSTGKDGWSGSHTGLLFDHGYSGTSEDRFGLWIGDGRSNFNFNSPRLEVDYPAESFYHIAVVFDSGTVQWYLNGDRIKQTSTSCEQVTHTGDRATYVGREYGGGGGINYFNGEIDELRYYERALDENTITGAANR